jgi:hypothetical protein
MGDSLLLLLLLYFRFDVRVELEAMTDAEGATLQVRYICMYTGAYYNGGFFVVWHSQNIRSVITCCLRE